MRFVVAVVVVLGTMLGTPSAAHVAAQEAATLNAFRAAPTPTDDFHLSRPTDQGHQRLALQVHADYANDPLVFEADDGQTWRVVAHQLNLNLAASVGLIDRVTVFVGLPVVAMMRGDSTSSLEAAGIVTPDGAGVGDLYMGARARIVGGPDEAFALGGQAIVSLPTGGGDRFRGEDFIAFRPELMAELHPGGGARLVANLGALVRRNGDIDGSNLAFSDDLTFGLGGAVPVWKDASANTHFDLHAQMYGASAGTPDVRVIAVIGYAEPLALPQAPPPLGDQDGDGLMDDVDPCPTKPEDVDGWLPRWRR